MGKDQNVAGFDLPRPPRDQFAAELYKKHNLPAEPSMAQIEPIAIKLLANPLSVIEGTSLALGRRVDARESVKYPFF